MALDVWLWNICIYHIHIGPEYIHKHMHTYIWNMCFKQGCGAFMEKCEYLIILGKCMNFFQKTICTYTQNL